jgi:glycerol kinase
MPGAVLALDQGTSATKALLVGPDGKVLAEAEVAVHPRVLPDGGVEQDPAELWDSLLDAGKQALAGYRGQLDAVAMANQGETVLDWDRRTGEPHGAALSWQDRRAAGVCDRLREHEPMLRERTGLTLDPYFAAPKIAWLRERRGIAGVATTTDSWLLHRLAGAYVTDAATASRTLLLDLDTRQWSAEACAVFGIDPETLPAVVPSTRVVGETAVFGPAVPVVGCTVDQQAALFAEGCHSRGEAKCTYGTGAFLLATVGAEPVRPRSGLVGSVAWDLGPDLGSRAAYCLDGQVYTAGAAVRWLARIGVIDHPSDLDLLALQCADSGGVRFVPALAGLAAPFWRPDARAAFTGMTLATDRAHLARAVLDGIAAGVAWLGRAVADDLGAPLRRLRVDGGLTRSRLLLQTQADLLQLPVEVYPSPHATALGVAAMARLGLDPRRALSSVVPRWRPSAVYEPAIAPDRAEEVLAGWRAAAEAATAL